MPKTAKANTPPATPPRPLHEIAREIAKDWKNPYFGAVPYLQGMSTLHSIDDHYGFDSGREIVLYFLANAQTWRGETARRIKAELNAMQLDALRRERR